MTTPITGYRELPQEDINSINALKQTGVELAEAVENLKNNPDADKRWIAIGETHLQQGMMALVRAIAKPEGF